MIAPSTLLKFCCFSQQIFYCTVCSDGKDFWSNWSVLHWVVRLITNRYLLSYISCTLCRLKSLKMKPMETPTLSLKPDLMHVDMQSSSSIGGFLFGGMFDSGASSVSLPKLFEDYGDDEHHVLYRTVAESIGDANREVAKLFCQWNIL